MTPPLGLLTCSLLAAVWTVDDDQPADFSSIQAAVASPLVQDGDVLRVGFGLYAPFTLTKRLTILGPATVADAVVQGVTKLASPDGFDVSHLRFASLEVSNAAGRARVSHCRVGVDLPSVGEFACRVTACAAVQFESTDVRGRPATSATDRPGGMRIEGARVVFSAGTVVGGDGESCFGSSCQGGDGGVGLEVLGASDVILVDAVVTGGAAGAGSCGLSHPCPNDGRAGDGMVVGLSTVRLRSCGVATGPFQSTFGGTPGFALSADAATVTASATAFTGPLHLDETTIVVPPAAEPTLALAGAPLVGAIAGLSVTDAPPSAPLLLLLSAAPGLVDVPTYEGKLWIDPASPFVLVAGSSTPLGALDVLLPIPSDPTLVGLAVDLQAAFPTVPGTLDPSASFLSGPVTLLLNGP